MGTKYPALLVFCAVSCCAQSYELGGLVGYGTYRNGSIYSPGGKAEAGVRNRFAAGAVFGQDLYRFISGEILWVYQDGHPFLSSGGVKSDIQGQSHAITYNVLFHLKDRNHRVRPFLAVGAGAKGYVIAGPAPSPQALPAIATLQAVDEWKFTVALGGGLKVRLHDHLLLRGEFLDYLTTFTKRQIQPAAGGTARGILQQFTPLFGVSYMF